MVHARVCDLLFTHGIIQPWKKITAKPLALQAQGRELSLSKSETLAHEQARKMPMPNI
jgi:hypothetical protein